jgi:large subunit ribosomal protein L1
MIKQMNMKFFRNSNFLQKNNDIIFNQFTFKNFASYLSIERMKEKRKNENDRSKKDENKEKTSANNEKTKKIFNPRRQYCSSPQEALKEIQKIPKMFPNQTLNIVIGLNVDPKRGDQNVRGIFKMPGGSNKIPKVMVFTSQANIEMAKAAGADMIADSNTYKNIQEGIIDFEKTVCTMDTLPTLKNYGRILGPLGLMPSTKIGTACTADNLEKIIKDLKMGSREFKVDQTGHIHLPIGRYDFPEDKILKNIDSLMRVVMSKQPESIKGRYLLYAVLNAYKHSYKIDLRSLDPNSATYFYDKENN